MCVALSLIGHGKTRGRAPPKKKAVEKKKKRLDVSRPSPHSFRSLKKSRVGELLPTRLFLLLLSTSPLSPNSVFLEHALIGRSARVACTSLASGGLSAGSPRKGESASPCFTTAASVFFFNCRMWGTRLAVGQPLPCFSESLLPPVGVERSFRALRPSNRTAKKLERASAGVSLFLTSGPRRRQTFSMP